MPNAHFYVRNHFQIPRFVEQTWRLKIGGLVERPLSLSLRDLKNMRSQSLVVTLECAGNGLSLLGPPIEGEKWELFDSNGRFQINVFWGERAMREKMR